MASVKRRRYRAHAPDERQLVQMWRRNYWSEGTIAQYLQWVRRFRQYCHDRRLDQRAELTLEGVREFACRYAGRRRRRPAPRATFEAADNALFAWAQALRSMGQRLPDWQPVVPRLALPRLIAEYVAFREKQCGVAATTIRGDVSTAEEFLALLRDRGRVVRRIEASDLDAFVAQLRRRRSRRTVRDTCSRLRSFLRFLQLTGRVEHDLASVLVAPRVLAMEKPVRTLDWSDVRRLLRSVRRDRPGGLRAFAVLLLMASYGFGAAEVAALRLGDIDWRGSVIRLQRPKTGAPLELPLLPAVARAVADYLRKGRPADAIVREIFVSAQLPRRPMSTGAIRHVVRDHARAAGIREPVGGHSLRHTHATRAIDAGANPKVVGDILGHRRPSSTSVYTRVAFGPLRKVALPVP